MTGIAGCFCLTPSGKISAPNDIVDNIAHVQAIPGINYTQRAHGSDGLVVVNVLTGHIKSSLNQPATDSDGHYLLFLEGEIFNLDDLSKGNEAVRENACATLLSLFLVHGENFVSRLRGQFNILICDLTIPSLMILNDPFGSKSMYYYKERDILLFGSEKKSLLTLMQDSPELDPVGLLKVFTHQHNVGSRTFIHNLRSLPAGSVLKASNGDMQVRTPARLCFPPVIKISSRQAIDRWCDLLTNSVKQQTVGRERIVLSLSGGLDSRAVACAIPRTMRPFVAITRKAANPLEVECARAIADGLGMDHRTLAVPAPPPNCIPAIVWRTECALSYRHCRAIVDHASVNHHFALGGEFGDVSSGGHIWPYTLEPSDRETFRRRAFAHYAVSRTSLEFIFNSDFLDQYLPQVEHEFCASFDGIDVDNNAVAYQLWDQKERQQNLILRAGLQNSYLFEQLFPFLNVDYYTFVCSLPMKWRVGQLMYRAVIHRLGPEVRNVPSANDGLRLRGTPLANRLEQWRGKVANRMRRLQQGRTKQAAQSQAGLRHQLRGLLRGFLDSEYFDGDIFDRTRIERLLDGELKGFSHVELLQVLATFAVGLPMFLHTSVKECPPQAAEYLRRS